MDAGEASQGTPFFIVGCGRSGTTLLRSMLDSHPSVGVPLESLFIIDYLLSSRPATVLQKLLPKEYELREWGVHCHSADLADCESGAEMIDRVHRIYLQQHGKNRWGQKTPRFVRYGELLRTHFPGARFIHVIRDPRAVTSSLVRSEVHRTTPYHAARRWQGDVAAGLTFEQNHPHDVLRIRYEDMVTRPETALRRVCQFLELEFFDDMLRYHEHARSAYGSYYEKIHSGLSKPVSAGAIDAWTRHLSEPDVALVEFVCGDLMERLGYEPRVRHVERPGWFSELVIRSSRLPRLLAQTGHYLIHRTGYLPCVARRKLVLRTVGPLPINR